MGEEREPCDIHAPRTKEYWQSWHRRLSHEIDVIDVALAADSTVDVEQLKKRRGRLAWDRWNVSKRLSNFPKME